MRKGFYTLINTLNQYDLTEEDYKDAMGEEPKDGEFEEWRDEQGRIEVEDFWDNLKELDLNCEGFIIEGTLGLWFGKRDIEQVFERSLYDAVSKCIGKDTYDMEVEKKGNHIEVSAHHHDGTNVFEIYGLSDKGYDVYQNRDKVSTKRSVNIFKLPEYLW